MLRWAAVAIVIGAALTVVAVALASTHTVTTCVVHGGGSSGVCTTARVHIWDERWWTAVARVLVSTLAASLLLGVLVAWTVGRRVGWPRASLSLGILGTALALCVMAIGVAAPLVHGTPVQSWPLVVRNYFLAGTVVFTPAAPNPFFWSPGWEYAIGSWTGLIPLGAAIGLGGGFFGLASSRALASVVTAAGTALLVVYAIAGWWAVVVTWDGIPL